jgi:competence ComEA-like helix-hairpin-helix protein
MRHGLDSRWIAVSGRELVLLAAAVLVVLATLAVGQVVSMVYGRGDTRVEESTEYLPPTGRIDINTAGADELTMLRGVGPVTAEAIVAHRAEHGPFRALEDLEQVHGIGPATVEQIRPHAMCRPPERTPPKD